MQARDGGKPFRWQLLVGADRHHLRTIAVATKPVKAAVSKNGLLKLSTKTDTGVSPTESLDAQILKNVPTTKPSDSILFLFRKATTCSATLAMRWPGSAFAHFATRVLLGQAVVARCC